MRSCARLSVVVAGVGLVAGLLASRPARACGGLVQAAGGTVGLNAQRAFFSVRANGTTELVLQVAVPSTPNDYGVILPAPVQPTLATTPVDSNELDLLEQNTRPEILETASGDGGGCGCGAVAGNRSLGVETQVTIGQVAQIGPVTAVTLTADTGAAVTTWLNDNGFVVPPAFQGTVDSYAGAGRWFVAFKRNNTAASSSATSVGVRLSMAGDRRDFAVRMAAMGADSEVAITVFVVASENVGPASNYTALTLENLDKATLRGGDYRGALKAAVAAAGGRAFVVEGQFAANAVVTMPTLSTLVDGGARLTRLSTVMDVARMDTDVVFNAAAPPAATNTITVSAPVRPGAVRVAGSSPGQVGMFLLGLGALLVWQERRRRG